MSETFDDRYFDLTMKVVNYAFEFVNQPGYAFLRMTDLLDSLVNLSSIIDGVDRKEFYEIIKANLKGRRNLVTSEEKTNLLNEILSIYIEEWRKSK